MIFKKASILCAMLFLGGTTAFSAPMKVRFIYPGGTFWKAVADMQLDASQDLGIESKSYGGDQFRTPKQPFKIGLRKAMDAALADKPDYIITYATRDWTHQLLKKTKGTNTKIYLINSAIDPAEIKKIGAPRTNFPNFLGQMYPDDEQAGFDLAKALVETARRQKVSNIEVVGTSGGRDSTPGLLRAKGLERYLKGQPDVKLRRLVYFNDWSPKRAAKMNIDLKKKHNNVAIGWAASDDMAIEIGKEVTAMGSKVNTNYFTGGFDWKATALNAIREGTVTASLGGHFMEGAWATVLLYDYHNGKDFKQVMDVQSKSKLAVVHPGNIDQLGAKLALEDLKKINFKTLSRHHNPSITKYNFELEKVLSATAAH